MEANGDFDAQAVADALRAELKRLGWTQKRLSLEAKVNDRTIWQLLGAKKTRYHQATLSKLSIALGLPHDALERVATGGKPPKPVGAPLSARVSELGRRMDLFEQRLMRIETFLERRLNSGQETGAPEG